MSERPMRGRGLEVAAALMAVAAALVEAVAWAFDLEVAESVATGMAVGAVVMLLVDLALSVAVAVRHHRVLRGLRDKD